jgi:hypothetical protein
VTSRKGRRKTRMVFFGVRIFTARGKSEIESMSSCRRKRLGGYTCFIQEKFFVEFFFAPQSLITNRKREQTGKAEMFSLFLLME